MKSSFKYLSLIILLFAGFDLSFAQEIDLEEINFDPIHTTIYPSTLNIDDYEDKKISILNVGDELVFNYHKLSKNVPVINFSIPVNPKQDYIMEFNFSGEVPDKFNFNKLSSIGIRVANNTVSLNSDFYELIKGKEKVSKNPKKWKLAKNEEGNISIKFERKNGIVTIFGNGAYLGEIKDSGTPFKEMNISISYFSLKKNNPLVFKSIVVDQGPVVTE